MATSRSCVGAALWGVLGAVVLLLYACQSPTPARPVVSADGDETEEPGCTTSRECAIGLFCSARGTCLSRCTEDAECSSGLCEVASGACRECMGDARCRELKNDDNAYCDLDYHVCRVACEACAADQVCTGGRCGPKPAEDGDGELERETDVEQAEVATCPSVGGKICQAGCRECVGAQEAQVCMDNGNGFSSEPCLISEYCEVASGQCKTQVCTPESKVCEGDTQKTCSKDGSRWDALPCPASQICSGGSCVDRICENLESPPLVFRFDARSAISSPDLGCDFVANRGTAEWANDLAHRGFLHFAGQNTAFLPASAISFSSHLLVAALIRPTRLSGTQSVLSKGAAASLSLRLEEDKPVFAINTDGQVRKVSGTCTLKANAWQWLLATFDGTTIALYKDGVLCGSPAVLSGTSYLQDNGADLRLGAADDTGGVFAQYFEGDIDTVYLGKTVLRANEIAQFDAAKNAGDPCPPSAAQLRAAYCPGLCNRQLLALPPIGELQASHLTLTPGESLVLDPGGCVRPTESPYQTCIPASGASVVNCTGCPASWLPKYALLYRFGAQDSELFRVLDQRQVVVVPPGANTLEFIYNDDNASDNSGGFVVNVERGYCTLGLCDPARPVIPGYDYCCKAGQVPLKNGLSCIDRYEASCANATDVSGECQTGDAALSIPGKQPWVDLSAEDARLACERSAKYACTLSEWQAACGGSAQTLYPYGDTHQYRVCNDATYTLSAPYTVLLPTGYLSGCVSDSGAFDLSGNAGEFAKDGTVWKAMSGKNQAQSRCSDGTESGEAGAERGFRCCTRYTSIPEDSSSGR